MFFVRHGFGVMVLSVLLMLGVGYLQADIQTMAPREDDPVLIKLVKENDIKQLEKKLEKMKEERAKKLKNAGKRRERKHAKKVYKQKLNEQNKVGDTALICAARLRNWKAMSVLLGEKANPNKANRIGETALLCAVKHYEKEQTEESAEGVILLLSNKVGMKTMYISWINGKNWENGRTIEAKKYYKLVEKIRRGQPCSDSLLRVT